MSDKLCLGCGKPLLVGQMLYAGKAHWECRDKLNSQPKSIVEEQVERMEKGKKAKKAIDNLRRHFGLGEKK